MKSKALGVVVVRVQVPELHDGHRYLLNSVTAIHENVLVVIGVSEARLGEHDPLPYAVRKQMVLASYPNVTVTWQEDLPSDEVWSRALDSTIRTHMDADESAEPVLYGGRDSFLSHYSGRFRIFELPPVSSASGTDLRESVGPTGTTDFRRGVIYASRFKYPVSYQCVDVAIVDGLKVLLGQKKRDGGKWRFIGGFVSPNDDSLEDAAKREVREETGIEPGVPLYLGSVRISDYRYRSGSDKLMSAFFVMSPVFGAGVAGDDIDDCRWFNIDKLKDVLVDEHLPLLSMLMLHPKENKR